MMKNSGLLPLAAMMLGLAASGAAYAQDTGDGGAADQPPADSSDAAVSDSTSTDTSANEPATPDSAPSDGSVADSSSDTASSDSSDSGTSGEPARSARQPIYVYAGADYAFLRTDLSKDKLKNALGGDQFDSDFYLLRFGARVFPQIGIEGQVGIKNENGNGSDKVETNQLFGLYVVPTGNLFRFLEVSAPIGYSHLKVSNDNGSVKFDAVSFGLNLEVPLYVNPNSKLPDIRLSGGGTMYFAQREARTYGYQAGLRFDFKI
jgi:hypothetical protein